MKVICDRGALVESLNLVSGVIVSRTPKPVLACVKLTASEDALQIVGTDLEVAVRLSTPRVEVEEPGEALIPADKLDQIVREIDRPHPHPRDRGRRRPYPRPGLATSRSSASPRPTSRPCPNSPAMPTSRSPPAELHRLISQTLFATARENSRYAINGVLLSARATSSPGRHRRPPPRPGTRPVQGQGRRSFRHRAHQGAEPAAAAVR